MLNKIARKLFGSANERFIKKQFKVVDKINALEPDFVKLTDEQLKAKTDEFRARIKDGETLIIGGMIKESEQKTVQKIPFLGDLPLFGPIFRSTSTSKTKNELVIMITPNIINDGDGAIADNI